jgi:murein DD-endopeptidase MepM/ murein hydrolase activator NlpD
MLVSRATRTGPQAGFCPRSETPFDTAKVANTTATPSSVQGGFLPAPSYSPLRSRGFSSTPAREVARVVFLAALVFVAASSAPARAALLPSSDVAALQVALRHRGDYLGPIDGIEGRATRRAIVSFQQHTGLEPDGIVGPRTRRALGRLGAPELGKRRLTFGSTGWDVAELQFLLAWHGFPSGRFDGIFGSHVAAAVRRFQRFHHLAQIGEAGPRTIHAARTSALPSSPLLLHAPIDAPIGDGFGPRGDAFHEGVDYIAPEGAPVEAARGGIVTWAAPRGTFGNAVMIAHGRGVRTLYAHLSRVDVRVGEHVASGVRIGLVGSTGRSTGPHLHFEVRLRGANVDPLSALG